MYYILDHYHAADHMDFCRIIRIPDDCIWSMYDIGEILTAVQFKFEETHESDMPDLDSVIELLEKHFGIKGIDKAPFLDDIQKILSVEEGAGYPSYVLHDFGGTSACTYLDLYEVRDRLCGPGQPEKLYRKWLAPEMEDDIGNLKVLE